MSSETKTIIIVGAGPTGLMAANLLGQQGVPVIVVERNAELCDLPRAVLLDDTSFRGLQPIELSQKMAEKSIMGYGSRYINTAGECFMEIGYKISEQGYPKRNSFSQPDLEKILMAGLERWDCVEVHMSTKVVAVEQDDDEVTVVAESATGKKVKFNGCLLLGCDGGRSTVRSILGIKMEGPAVEQDWLVIDVQNDPDKERYTKFTCTSEGAHLTIPQPGGGRRYEYLLGEGEDRKEVVTFEAVKKRLASDRDLSEEDLTRAAVYTFHALVAAQLVVGRAVLMGDAAHLTPPFAGQGLNAGLRDAMAVAWRAALVAQGAADVEFLQGYYVERHHQMRDMIDFALNLGKIMMPETEFDEKVTERIFRLVGLIPEARDYVYNMRFKPKMHLHRGFCVRAPGMPFEDDQGGKKIPQPIVHLRDGRAVMLDELLGTGFSCVGLGVDTVGLMTQFDSIKRGRFALNQVVLIPPHEHFPSEDPPNIQFARIDESVLVDPAFGYLPDTHQVILVRPDRYCIAGLSAKSVVIMAPRIKALFAGIHF